jgi:aryl-alcohol dehydrogenase-like predicted oxidoreductase
MNDKFTRRHFLGTAVAAAAAANVAEAADEKALPTRVLGRTDARVTVLALGCGSRLSSYGTEDRAVEAINLALDLGIKYIDTAQSYGNGKSETWVGQVMKQRRNGVFLATKISTRNGDEALRSMDESLKRLQTDHLDLVHIHGLNGEDDLAKVEAKDGVMQALYKLREQKVTRFIGITSHYDPMALKSALEHNDFDCVQMALNAALQGMTDGPHKMIINPSMKTSFETVALPVAKRKNLGVLAMKVTGQEDLVGDGGGKASMEKLFQYALSLPIAAAVIGMPKLEHIRRNVELARSFKQMPKTEMKDFSRGMSEVYKAALDRKFARHIDA